ncbi:MAG: hypothetical protein CMK07_01950 [Ponticaulis sp.]|nr:hypothetical protein [Ponticaulis sp.]
MEQVIGMLVTALITGGIAWLFSRTRANQVGHGRKMIRMGPLLVTTLIFFSFLIFCFGVFVTATSIRERDFLQVLPGLAITLMFGPMLPVMIQAYTDVYDVTWDDYGITGPSTLYSFEIRSKRHTLRWEDLVDMGETILQTHYVESHDGKRVCWSAYYAGYAELEDEIVQRLIGDEF